MLIQDALDAGEPASASLGCGDGSRPGGGSGSATSVLAEADAGSKFDSSRETAGPSLARRDFIDSDGVLRYRLLPAGDTALVIEFGSRIDRRLNAQVLALARRLAEVRLEGVIETVPTFRSLMVHYDPLVLSAAELRARIHALIGGMSVAETTGRHWSVPVCYDARVAPDLDDVATRTGLSTDEVIERHSSVSYYVYMLGFLPGMAYLGDLPAELTLPRRATPRLKIPAGSLAIANTMTSILPRETPCGWHVIGRSPVPFFRVDPVPRALLSPGDTVTFTPVSLREFEDLSAQAAAERLCAVPATGAAA
jgi:inhibitor of KinA